jgi:hypothetical protein
LKKAEETEGRAVVAVEADKGRGLYPSSTSARRMRVEFVRNEEVRREVEAVLLAKGCRHNGLSGGGLIDTGTLSMR